MTQPLSPRLPFSHSPRLLFIPQFFVLAIPTLCYTPRKLRRHLLRPQNRGLFFVPNFFKSPRPPSRSHDKPKCLREEQQLRVLNSVRHFPLASLLL